MKAVLARASDGDARIALAFDQTAIGDCAVAVNRFGRATGIDTGLVILVSPHVDVSRCDVAFDLVEVEGDRAAVEGQADAPQTFARSVKVRCAAAARVWTETMSSSTNQSHIADSI